MWRNWFLLTLTQQRRFSSVIYLLIAVMGCLYFRPWDYLINVYALITMVKDTKLPLKNCYLRIISMEMNQNNKKKTISGKVYQQWWKCPESYWMPNSLHRYNLNISNFFYSYKTFTLPLTLSVNLIRCRSNQAINYQQTNLNFLC